MSSDLLSLATFKSTTPTCFHWNPYSEEKQSQMSIIHNYYYSAFSRLNHHCPLHTSTNAPTFFSWNMYSTLEMNWFLDKILYYPSTFRLHFMTIPRARNEDVISVRCVIVCNRCSQCHMSEFLIIQMITYFENFSSRSHGH